MAGDYTGTWRCVVVEKTERREGEGFQGRGRGDGAKFTQRVGAPLTGTGTWVLAPEVGLLWTPGYWGWENKGFIAVAPKTATATSSASSREWEEAPQ